MRAEEIKARAIEAAMHIATIDENSHDVAAYLAEWLRAQLAAAGVSVEGEFVERVYCEGE